MVICSTKLRFNINRARCFVVVLAFTLSFLWVKASTPPQFIHLDSQTNGLSYDAVKCLCEDSNGFVWIGTQNGLNRWDGSRMKVFGHDRLGTQTDYIRALYPEDYGNVLIGTDEGLVLYDWEKDVFRRLSHPCENGEILDNRVFSIARSPDSLFWIGVRDKGLFTWDSEKGKMAHIALPAEIKTVYRLTIDGQGLVYLASYCKDVYRYHPKDGVLEPITGPEGRRIFLNDDVEGVAISKHRNGLLYVASKKMGLCAVNGKTGECKVLYTIPEPYRPVDLMLSDERILWLSTTYGLVRFDLETNTADVFRRTSSTPFSLSDDFATCTLPLKNGDLWIGTEYSGVNYYGHHQDYFKKTFQTMDGISLRDCVVRSFSQDENGIVWIGTEHKGLLRLDPRSRIVTSVPLSASSASINAVCADKNRLWIGSNKGLYLYDTHTRRGKTYTMLAAEEDARDNRVVTIFRSDDGDVFVSTAIGVFRYDESRDSFSYLDALGDTPMEDMAQDSEGRIWMASYNSGLFGYDPKADSVLFHICSKKDDSPIPEMTSSLCLDGKGNLWIIGFSSGFCKMSLRTMEIISYSKKNIPALPTDVFYSALTDDKGHLWLSSDKGLVEFLPASLGVKVFSKMSGLLDESFRKSCLKERLSGELYFGSSNGFITFSPHSFLQTEELSKTYITELLVGGETVLPDNGNPILTENIDLTQNIALPHSSSSFGFKLAVPSASALAGSSVLCRLIGYDEKWRDVTNTKEVYYYNVPSGDYTFELRTVTTEGRISWKHPVIGIQIKPPFWASQTGIVLLSVILTAILFIVFFLYRYFYDRNKEKALYQEKKQFFTNIIHEIKTPLTLISTPLHNLLSRDDVPDAARNDLSLIETSTDYMGALVKDLLEFIRIEEYGYTPQKQNADIIKELKLECSNFSSTAKDRNQKLTLRCSEESLICSVDIKAFDKIVNNLLSNALKFADSTIEIEESLTKDGIVLRFRNDGPPIPPSRREAIFEPFVQYSGERAPYAQSFGIGLTHAKMLAEMNGGSLRLSDKEQTEFVLTLPFAVGTLKEETKDSEKEPQAVPGKPLILVVEDNSELLSYLKSYLKSSFAVKGASSAEKAWDIVKTYKVDLVITDLALKGMSGLSLLKSIKADSDIHFTPVIIISAISSEETKVACLNAGAEMYLEKPFTMDYLNASIQRALSNLVKLQSSHNEAWTETTDPVILPNRDADFMKRLNEIIQENLGNASYSIAEMENDLFMSRSALNRKMKALLNTTPSEHLRRCRIEKAAELLQTEGVRVNEVAYMVGFTSASYFARCFRQQFGCLPTEYAKKHQSRERR